MPAQTVLILGAGASCSYGFPVGSQLRQRILALQDDQQASDMLMTGMGSIRAFVREFSNAQTYSIDAFLGRRPGQFGQIGKSAIAYELLKCERQATLFDEIANKDHWYQYLLNAIASDRWDDFDPSWLSIVNFNYDRSLEQFLRVAVRASYGRSVDEVNERLRSIRMVHVYGSLGPLDGRDSVQFGGIDNDELPEAVRLAATRLEVIPEGRIDAASLFQARQIIADAERVCFLGFGFDRLNVERLGAPHTFCNAAEVPKRSAATCFGLTDAETERASQMVFARQASMTNFSNATCLDMLRRCLILD